MLKLMGILVFLGLALSANAAERFATTQFTCRPEFDYFSLRTKDLEFPWTAETPDIKDKNLRKNSKKEGFYLIDELPYQCKLAQYTFEVKRNFLSKNYNHMNPCDFNSTYNLEIWRNGKKVYEFYPFGQASCMSPESHEVLIYLGRMLTDCTMSYDGGNGKSECSMKWLDKD